MTLSEYERRALDEIETACRRDDPVFADSLDPVAVRRRRSSTAFVARLSFWSGWLVLAIGVLTADGPFSLGVFIACYGVVILGAATVTGQWIRRRPG